MTDPAVRLSDAQKREQKILFVLDECDGDFSYMAFDGLSRETGIERRVVRLVVRRMARKGWTQYGRGLWTDDGEMAGSGYCITDAGRAALTQGRETER